MRTVLLSSLGALFLLLGPAALATSQESIPPSPSCPEKEQAQAVEQARTALAKKLGLEEKQLVLESAKAATWGNASLGCPEPDRMYAQVVTKGYAVVFSADGKQHKVHVAGKRIVFCASKS